MRNLVAFGVTTLFFIGLLASPVKGQDAPDFATVLSEDTDVVVFIQDFSALRATWSESGWEDLWTDPQMSPVADSMRAYITEGLGENGEEHLRTLLDLIEGQVAWVLPDLSGLGRKNEEGEEDVSWALMIELRAPEKMNAFVDVLQVMDEQPEGEEIEETVKGISVVTRRGENGKERNSRTFARGVAVFGYPSDYVKEIASTLGGGRSRSPLSGKSGFKRMRQEAPQAQNYFFLNFSGLTRLLTQGMEAGMSEDPSMAMMGLTPQGVTQALSLDALDSFYLTSQDLETESVLHSGLLFRRNEGLVRMMAYLPGPTPRPGFIPENALMASVSRFSVTEMWNVLLEIFETMSPGMATLFQTQLQQISMSYGVDIETDILGSLGETSFSTYLPSADSAVEPDQIFGLEIKDGEGLAGALGVIRTAMGSAEESEVVAEVGGIPIYALIELPPGQQSFYYAFTDTYLLVCQGSQEALVTFLENMRSPGPALWNRADLKPQFDRLPSDASVWTYYDMATMFDLTYGAILKAQEEDMGPSTVMPDWGALKDHFGPLVGASFKNDDGVFGVAYLRHTR